MALSPILYHAFPRRGGSNAGRKGLAILRSILDVGLLITPEIVPWVSSDGTPFRIAQKRICFTAVEPDQLREHARLFGEIAVGFERAHLEAAGAAPVFYVPRSASGMNQEGNVGGFHIERIYQLLNIVKQVHRDGLEFTFNDKPIDLQDMASFTRYLSTMFYPIDDLEARKERHYFAQREWRIQGNLIFKGEPLSRRLTQGESDGIVEIDRDFFTKPLEFPTGTYPQIQQAMIMATVAGRPLRNSIAAVVCTARHEQGVRDVLASAHIEPAVQVLPDL